MCLFVFDILESGEDKMMSQNVQTMNYAVSMPTMTASHPIERDTISSSKVFYHVFWALFLLLIPVCMEVMCNGINIQKEYDIQTIRRDVMTMQRDNDLLKLQVSKLDAPIRIQQIAEKELKMTLPLRTIYGEADPSIPVKNKGRY